MNDITSVLPAIARTLAFIVYLIFSIVFIVYSKIGLNHLKNYGYVGDACQQVSLIYIIISIVIFSVTITTLIFI